MKQVEVVWRAFGNETSVEFEIDFDGSDLELRNQIFQDTNLYSGKVWDKMVEAGLPADRTHTALSVGDDVRIGETIYRCAEVGWNLVGFLTNTKP